MTKSTIPAKPAKPYPDFPLFPHATRRWAKKIRGKTHYFGPWSDPTGAIAKYDRERDDLHAGRVPRAPQGSLTILDLCNAFCASKEKQAEAGDITARSFRDYHKTCKQLLAAFGRTRAVSDLRSADFEELRHSLARRLNPNSLGNEVQRIRSVLKYGYDAGLLDSPVRVGPTFRRPPKRILRAERQKKGPRMFEARHLRRLLKAASHPLKAMILLGINCGFGNHDCGTLPISALDLRSGWINFPRPKTAIERRCPLWPETIAALREAIAQRPAPKDPVNDGLVFITKYGEPWAKETNDNPITKEMRKLLDRLSLHRPGIGFYALRHTFETIAGECKDQVAVNAIMGHADASMAAHYRERIGNERLIEASDSVRRWLFRSMPQRSSVNVTS
ncbi:MAG: tyrosine-type recombinase/integrase [Planctomycetaceae bacterium]|nr:tyrosine-type recombinase/integrase [Planctomycetaceae bacterium]